MRIRDGGFARAAATVLGALVAVATLTACGDAGSPGGRPDGPLRVVAAEDMWGSIAAQVGGPEVRVRSIIDNPDADPHDYEPTTADARAVATADVVLVNGIGYDTWASKLVAANPVPGRVVITVGDLLGVPAGGNPHRWYDPDAVVRVAERLVSAYATLAPARADAFQAQGTAFTTQGLADYRRAAADIRGRYAGTPVGASESIAAMLTPALGLDLVTPPAFLRAVSEGTDPSAADTAAADNQITGRKIRVYVLNAQNATPDVQRQVDAARAAGIPVSTITETTVPAGATWQAWQTRQLLALRDALATARTGRS